MPSLSVGRHLCLCYLRLRIFSQPHLGYSPCGNVSLSCNQLPNLEHFNISNDAFTIYLRSRTSYVKGSGK